MSFWQDEAIRQAFKSTSKFRLGAVLVNGKHVFYGNNWMDKTHPKGLYLLESTWIQVGVHAEMDVLIQAKEKAEDSKLYVARVLKDGRMAMAEPCPRCKYLIKKAGVKLVFYTTSRGTWAGMPPYRWR